MEGICYSDGVLIGTIGSSLDYKPTELDVFIDAFSQHGVEGDDLDLLVAHAVDIKEIEITNSVTEVSSMQILREGLSPLLREDDTYIVDF